MTADLPTGKVRDWLEAKARRAPKEWWTIREIAKGVGSPETVVGKTLSQLATEKVIYYVPPDGVPGGKARMR